MLARTMDIAPARARRDLLQLVHRTRSVREFSLAAVRIIGRVVPYDGVCVVTLDPATALPTGEISERALPPHVRPRMAQIEIGGDDVNSFRALLASGRHAASLGDATNGDLCRSLRHRELRAPHGFGDELRAVLVSEHAAWGGLTLLRGDDHRAFSAAEVSLVSSLGTYLAEGIRRGVLLTALSGRRHEGEGGAGLVLLDADDSIVMSDAAGEAWLARLAADDRHHRLPLPVAAVARRTGGGEALPAQVRVRAASGDWLVVRGTALSGEGDARVAITIEPARAYELAPMIADAYGLSERERAVTQLIAKGLPTARIASRLGISPWTVQDYLKSIFEKVGVNTRGELVADVFFAHYAPRLSAQDPLGQDGWFTA